MPVDILGGTAIRPVQRDGLEAVKWFLYNKETGAIMGRTPKSWFLITLFYMVYYAVLAAFWAACLFVFMQTIDEKVPKWTTDGSLIGSSPGLGVRPNQSEEFIDSSIITFNQASEETAGKVAGWGEWVARIDDFLEPYRNQKGVDCTNGPAPEGRSCNFDLANLGSCGEGKYGYDKGKPCIFLKLNKIYNLVHQYYNDTNTLKEDVPERVRTVMKGLSGEKLNQVWVNCHGENPADNEAIGNVKYFPAASGFESKYFPFTNQEDYVTPLVAVQFMNPTAGQLVHIECRAYAGNIGYNRRDKIGRAHFELMIHNAATAAHTAKQMAEL